jgi:toxin ParE1/3/4
MGPVSKPVVLRPAADRDLDEIVAFLHKESRQAARCFSDAVGAAIQLIGDHPGIGSTRHAEICHESPRPLRFHPLSRFPRILVYYVDRPEVVEIIRIWDAARGLEALMEEVKGEPLAETSAVYVARSRVSSVRRSRETAATHQTLKRKYMTSPSRTT